MEVYQGLRFHVIGAWKYNMYDNDTSCVITTIVPKDRIDSILSNWKEARVTVQSKPDRYIVEGSGFIPNVPVASKYILILIPKNTGVTDRHFVLSNPTVGKILEGQIILNSDIDEMNLRLSMVITWAKLNNFYGGSYPDANGYAVYCANTILNGYSREMVISSLHRRILYTHSTCGDMFISHIPISFWDNIKMMFTKENKRPSLKINITPMIQSH